MDGPALYVIACFVSLAAYSSWNRPLWYDEMVYFVLGGFGSTADVLSVIQQTTTNVNQGVTGAYMLVAYWSLEIFGAHFWALRLPSLLFGIYFFIVAAVFLRIQKVGWLGVTALPVLLMGQQTLMYYIGEARTYIPLAAATVGVLAYYFIPIDRRRRTGPRLLGWSAVLVGVTFHPYFAVYWPLVLAFALTVTRSWRIVVRFANPFLVLTGAVVYFAIAGLTWLRGTAKTEDLNPYTWLGDSLLLAIPAQLFQFVYVQRTLVIVSGILVISSLVLASRGLRPSWVLHRWSPAIALILVAFIASWIISATSIAQEFWVIPRQWIASIALTSVAIIWFWSRAIASVQQGSGARAASSIRIAVGAVIAISAIAPLINQFQSLADWRREITDGPTSALLTEEDLKLVLDQFERRDRAELTEQEWVDYSNANIAAGGAVWEDFQRYYRDRDWTQFVLRD